MKIDFDQKFLEKIKKIIYNYEEKIPQSMYYYYNDILKESNLDMHMQTYSLSKEELLKYAKVCKIIVIYKEISDLLEIIKSEAEVLEKEELEEYQEIIDELQDEGEEFISSINIFEKQKDNTINFGNSANLLIYSNYIDESRQRTVNAHSGKEEQTQKSVANLIRQLSQADYYTLRKNGYIHQNQLMGTNKPCYVEGNAYERVGRGSTKVNYIRISVSEKNREEIQKNFNINFDTFYLIVCYGDFKNEGQDELKYFNEIYLDLKKHSKELLSIINIFKNDFTSKTRPLAMDLINNGFKITEDLTSVINNKQYNL